MYDNTKLEAAFAAWLEKSISLGYGEHYVGDLLADFEDFLRETKMLKRSPGVVAFGKLLAKPELDLDKRKRLGLTFWSGLELKDPPEQDALKPRRYARTTQAQDDRAEKQARIRREREFQTSEEAEQARLAAFKEELESETPEKIKGVGHEAEM